ncbi:MAG: oxidoreductase [Bacteroidetes bacterium]|nr:oxidoreductase [Bacteroidota bacterium]MBI3483284.1 oxidoreductase [Bacteroidota bacterium]
MKRSLLSISLLISFQISFGQFQWKNISVDTKSSFRALSVVDDKVAWVGGSIGTIGRTRDGGKTFSFKQVNGFETLDFRSVYAFDSLNVVIANAGSPSFIFHTTDGGKNWKQVYRNDAKEAFIDGIDFWNDKKGMIYGDPINGKMLLISTNDGGITWSEVHESQRPILKEGEASFAASGTGIRCFDKKKITITTGGKISRLWTSNDSGETWSVSDLPIIQGIESAGAFSSVFWNKKGVVVGGDYKNDLQTGQHVYLTLDKGKSWNLPIRPTRGLREAVESLGDDYLVAVGPQGADQSNDGGMIWVILSDEKGFHTIRKAREGSLIMAAGNGKIAVITKKTKP